MFSVRGFEASFPRTGTLGCVFCLVPQLFLLICLHANMEPLGPPAATSPSPPCRVSSLPRLPVSIPPTSLDECFLTPWLLDFHTVQCSGSSSCFLFLNLLLSFIWLWEEAQCVYLCFHLGWKSFLDSFYAPRILFHFLKFLTKMSWTQSLRI